MPSSKRPRVFVSSTCYDLKQVRADLRDFIQSIGFEPILSDYDSFPVDPVLSTVENCLKAVDESADLFVLIIGGRYGSENLEGKSITNLEYLRAKAKGAPVYAFVHRPVLEALSIWKDNPGARFTSVVESNKVFEFIEAVRNSGETWTYAFDHAQEIVAALRTQWAYLFSEALVAWKRLRDRAIPTSLRTLPGSALRVLVERPKMWEHWLYLEILDHEIDFLKEMDWDVQHGVTLGPMRSMGILPAMTWMQEKTSDLSNHAQLVETLVNIVLKEALGPPGAPGDPERLAYAARKLAALYKRSLESILEYRQIDSDELKELLARASKLHLWVIEGIDDLRTQLRSTLSDLRDNPPAENEVRTISLKLEGTRYVPEINEELARVHKRLGLS